MKKTYTLSYDIPTWYITWDCKRKGHIVDGCYQGYVPDLGFDEICCHCGQVIRTWEDWNKAQEDKNE